MFKLTVANNTYEEVARDILNKAHEDKDVLVVVNRTEHMNFRNFLNLFILENVYGVNTPTNNDIKEMQIVISQYLKGLGTIRFVNTLQNLNEEYSQYEVVEI